jgi:hypothetical protein
MGQTWHEMLPVAAAKVPMGQTVQVLAPGLGLNAPAGHMMHAELSAPPVLALAVPAGQGVGLAEPLGQ